MLLRTARELLDAQVPARRVRAALEALREQLPAGHPLSAVHISALGDRILVRDEGSVWEPDSGQIQIDFAVAEVAERADEVARRALADSDAGQGMSADDWYNTGVDLEAVSVESAAAAYRRALEAEPSHADAHLNLGRLLHEEGRLAEAESHYRAAGAAEPANARAHYNIGVALEDRAGPAKRSRRTGRRYGSTSSSRPRTSTSRGSTRRGGTRRRR